MSAAIASPRMGFKFILTIRAGPDVGMSFQLLPPQVTIGRGTDCHVVLNDPRASRNAAVINFSMEHIIISDASGRSALFINDENLEQSSLQDGDVIRIGDSEMTFFVESIDLRPQPHLQALGGTRGAGGMPFPPGAAPPPSFSSGGLSKRQRFYLILGVVGLAFAALMATGKVVPRVEVKYNPNEALENQLKDSAAEIDKITAKRVFKSDEEKTRFEEANKHFGEGFRDYEKGQWVRAMRSFETALTIDPQNQLAGRYYRLAEKMRDQMIADLTLEARRYREKGMYSRCSAQFEKVLDMITNHEDAKYKLADSLKKECDLHLENQYRY